MKQQPPTLSLRELEGSFAEDLYNMGFFKVQYTLILAKFSFFLLLRTVTRCCWWSPLTGCCKTSGTGLSSTYFTSTSLSTPCTSPSSLQLLTTDLYKRMKRYITAVICQGTTHHMVSQMCLLFECVLLTSKFSPFLKAGGRF